MLDHARRVTLRAAVRSLQCHNTMQRTPIAMRLKPTTSLTTFRRRLGESRSFLGLRGSKPTSANGACGPIIELGKLPGPTTITNPIAINRPPSPTTTQFIRPSVLGRIRTSPVQPARLDRRVDIGVVSEHDPHPSRRSSSRGRRPLPAPAQRCDDGRERRSTACSTADLARKLVTSGKCVGTHTAVQTCSSAAELLAGDAAADVEQMVLGVVQCVSDDGGRVDHPIFEVDSDHDLLFRCE